MLVVGSRARLDHPADVWSDLDTIAFVDDSGIYSQPGSWRDGLESALGVPVWLAAFSNTARNDPEWEFVLQDGAKIDIVFLHSPAPNGHKTSLSEMVEHSPYRYVYERGVRTLIDKSPGGQAFHPPAPPPRPLPDQSGYDQTVANFLLDLIRAAKLARRGELWRAARAINVGMQGSLLTLIEWHAGPRRETGGAAWYYGRFLEEWADPRILAVLPAAHTANTLPGIRRSVIASLDLLAWLGPETAHRLDLVYPYEAVERVDPWLRKILQRPFENKG